MLSSLSLSTLAMAIRSRLQMDQLSVFLRTEQLVLSSICHLILENLMFFDVVNLTRAVV